MDAISAIAEYVGLAIYRLLPRRVRQYVEYDSLLGHVLVFGIGLAAMVAFGALILTFSAGAS